MGTGLGMKDVLYPPYFPKIRSCWRAGTCPSIQSLVMLNSVLCVK